MNVGSTKDTKVGRVVARQLQWLTSSVIVKRNGWAQTFNPFTGARLFTMTTTTTITTEISYRIFAGLSK